LKGKLFFFLFTQLDLGRFVHLLSLLYLLHGRLLLSSLLHGSLPSHGSFVSLLLSAPD
jgi:hypothetical protein